MIFLPKAALLLGLGIWLAIALCNNLVAFRNGSASIGGMMAMRLFDQEPAIQTPLTARRVTGAGWHVAVYSTVLLLEAATALLLIAAAVLVVMNGTRASGIETIAANWAVSAFIGLAGVMLAGGAWFVYYIRQEGSQLTHLVMFAVGAAGAILVNLPMA